MIMKKTLTQFSILVASICVASVSLVGCSTNTQKQNTAVGAVSGAVVGGLAGSAIGSGAGTVVAVGTGAIVGALIGGAIGHSMDSTDNTKTYQAMNNPSNKPMRWKNKKTGYVYTVVPTSKMMTVNGNPNCRAYRTKAIIHGTIKRVHGIACMQADGTWHAVSA